MTIEALSTLCLSLPAVTEDVKWEHLLCYMVGGKIFCTASLDDENRIGFKVTKEEYEELTAMEGIIPAPYFWKASWVRVQDATSLTWKEQQAYIQRSYELVKATLPKKVRDSF